MTSGQSLTDRIHALIFNGITKASAEDDGFDSWLPLSERERFARAVVDELRAGDIQFRLGGLALLAEVAAGAPPRWRCNTTERCLLEDGHEGPHGFPGNAYREPAADHQARLAAGTED